jgi:hypothetical protein
VLADERSTLGLLVVALAGLALGCLAGLALVAAFPFPVVGPPSSGVVGFVTVHGYPESREAAYYVLILLLMAVATVACVAGWVFSSRLVARRAGLDVIRASSRDALAYLPCFIGLGIGLLKGSGVLMTFVGAVAAVVAAKIAILAWPHGPSPLAGEPIALIDPQAAAAPSAKQDAGRWFGAAAMWPAAAVVLAGCVFGWFLPMAVPSRVARTAVSAWWLWPLVFVGAWLGVRAVIARRDGDRTDQAASCAALPFLPALLVSIEPFLVDFLRARLAVLALALIAMAGTFVVALRPSRRPVRAAAHRIVRASALASLVAVAMASSWQPDFPGIHVLPGDGDHLLAFLNDGLHGKVVYRDFWYPYGPLFYLLELSSARLVGLDRYYMPAWLITTALGTLLLFLTARHVFLTRPFQVLGGLLLFLLWPPLTVQFRVYGGYFTAVLAAAAAAAGGAWALRAAGALAAAAFLFSHEAAIAAIVGSQAGFLWAARQPTLRETMRAYGVRLGPFLAGLAAVLVPVAWWAAATGTLGPYLSSTFGFVAVNDECCGLPVPNLREELSMGGQRPTVRLGNLARFLLTSPVFRHFYLPVLVYVGVVMVVTLRALRGSRPLRQDVVQLALAGFGLVFFRVALGRSDPGHAQFATVPALALGCALLERAALRGLRVMRTLRRPGASGLEGSVELAVLSAAFAFLGWAMGLPALPRALGDGATRLAHYHELRSQPRASPGWTPVLSAQGGRFCFPAAAAPTVQATFDYLRTRTGPGEAIFAFPYAFRYNVLLDRPNPLKFGSCIWGAAARPVDQRRLVAELVAARVRHVVYDESEWPDLDGVPTGDRFADLADFIFDHYAPERRIGQTSVLRLRETTAFPPPSVVDVAHDEDRPFLRRGWYYPEPVQAPAGSSLVAARWTSSEVTVRLTRRAADRELFVEALVYVPTMNLHRWLRASVDGRQVGQVDLSTLSGWTTLRFTLAGSEPREGPVLVRMDIDPFPAPRESRILGAIVKRVGFD